MTDSTMTATPLVERVARRLAMFMFETWGDAEGVVWAGLDEQEKKRARQAAEIATAEAAAMLKAAVDALEWYREQAEGCRKIGYIGEPFRRALDADGGKRAADTLASLKQPGGR